jgi:hypothetical protein
MVVTVAEDGRIRISIERGYDDIWKQTPFIDDIKKWSFETLVAVFESEKLILFRDGRYEEEYRTTEDLEADTTPYRGAKSFKYQDAAQSLSI